MTAVVVGAAEAGKNDCCLGHSLKGHNDESEAQTSKPGVGERPVKFAANQRGLEALWEVFEAAFPTVLVSHIPSHRLPAMNYEPRLLLMKYC